MSTTDPQACRAALRAIAQMEVHMAKEKQPAHAGLLLQRYLETRVKTSACGQDGGHPAARLRLLKNAILAARNALPVYEAAYRRWRQQLPASATHELFRVQGRLVSGLGGASVLETGIALHHIYGVPWLPGSAVKGLAAHYCDRVWGNHVAPGVEPTDEQGKWRRRWANELVSPDGEPTLGRYHAWLFGTTESAGFITWHDAWLDPACLESRNEGLVHDVMTPHHAKYYSGEKYQEGATPGQPIPPTDFDNPNPIRFLSTAGRFHFAVSCENSGDPNQKALQHLAWELLKQAVRDWGAGGKTSSGYGRLAPTGENRA